MPSLLFNIAIPALLMMKGQKWLHLSAQAALAIALLFPLAYGVRDLWQKKSFNLLSILGFVSLLLTGGIGLLRLPQQWVAIKEAAVPLFLGTFVLLSAKMKKPLVYVLLYNEQVFNIQAISDRLEQNGTHKAFQQVMKLCTWLLAGSFYLSAALNYLLAKVFIHSETGSVAFTEELGKMTAWSYPVIVLPCTLIMMLALWILLTKLQKQTGLPMESLFASHLQEKVK